MKIGIGMGSYTRQYGLEDGLRRIKAHGYDALDYGAFIHTENQIFHVDEATFRD